MKIRAAVLEQFAAPLVVQEVDLGEPRGGEVLVRLHACGICHTDMYCDQVPQLVDRYLEGDIDANSFISHRLTLEQINDGFELMHRQDGIRSVIQFTA